MPYQRKDSPIWWASFTDTSGQRIRLSTGTTDRKEVEALGSKWKLEVHQALKWGKVPSRSFDELMLRYVREVEKRSAERDQFSIRRLYPFFSGRAINQLSASDVRDYVNLRRSNGVTAATINKEVGLLRAAINYANKEWDWGLPNPASGRKLRESAGRMRWITQGQAGLLIRSAASEPNAPHLVDFIQLGLFSGMRKGEMLGLEWKRVDLSAGLIYTGS